MTRHMIRHLLEALARRIHSCTCAIDYFPLCFSIRIGMSVSSISRASLLFLLSAGQIPVNAPRRVTVRAGKLCLVPAAYMDRHVWALLDGIRPYPTMRIFTRGEPLRLSFLFAKSKLVKELEQDGTDEEEWSVTWGNASTAE